MTEKAALPSDAIAIPVAGRLLGLHPERIRQLVRAGHATSPARGYVGLTGLLRGYVAALRAEAERGDSEGGARQHLAKAELVQAATTRRRSELIERIEAEAALGVILETATRHLRSLTKRRSAARGLPDAIVGKIGQETEVALIQITDAHAAAVAALRTGDFSAISGGGDGR